MDYRFLGDTVTFSHGTTVDGTAFAYTSGSLYVYDGNGLNKVATNVSASNGTFSFSADTAGWGKGLLFERWVFSGTGGTTTVDVTDQYRMVGTEIVRTYIVASELPTFYENVEDYFDGKEDYSVLDAYQEVNKRLESLGHKTPFTPNTDGYFDQPLRDLNAYEAIFRLVQKRQSSFVRDGRERPWFFAFKDAAEKIYKAVENKAYSFSREYGAGEGGVGVTSRAVGTSVGTVESNWRGGVGNGFSDSTYERLWKIQVIGTGTTGGLNECEYSWSKDGGLTSSGTKTSSTEWEHLDYGVYVRFHRGDSEATTNIFDVGDTWQFKSFPKAQTNGGKNTARSY